MLFDTHAHYDDEKFDNDRAQAIGRAVENGVSLIVNASSDVETSKKSIELAQQYEFIYAAVGIHPHEVEGIKEADLEQLKELSGNCKKVVAIGEIGLDYYYDTAPRHLQREWFARQINTAREIGLPIIVHNRDSHQDAMDIIKAEKASDVGGVFHCYSGSLEMARELIKLNFYIAVGGVVTFKNARRIAEVVSYVPEDRLLIETDCPYLAPEPFRGKRNESSYIINVARKIAEIRNTSFENVASFTTENGKRLFKIN